MTSKPNMRTPLAVAAVAAGALALGGCGGSDKPQYCSDRSALEQSIKDVGNVTTLGSGTMQQLESQLKQIKSDALALVDSAKSDFPSETTAMKSSVDALSTTLQGLPSSPTAQQIARAATEGAAVISSFKSFQTATDQKCK